MQPSQIPPDDVPGKRFPPALEAEYVRADLIRNRSVIRTAAVLALLLALSRATERALTAPMGGFLLVHLGLCLVGSIVLVGLAWSASFERFYLPWAQVIVPARNAITAAHFAEAVVHGQIDVLMALPVMLIGPPGPRPT